VAVVPSLYEGFSLPAIEAMACGVALVATTGGALPEVVGTDGVTGLLVAPDDPGALALAIGRLLDDDELRQRLGAAGRQRVLGRFTWQVTASGTAAEYQALLADQGPGPTGPGVLDHVPSSSFPPEPGDHDPNLRKEVQPC
jgi:glycosyltransferase involved in cell wall biosynthesis